MVYEELLAEQVNNHLSSKLQEIASERAEAICKPYLETIGNHERQLNNTSDDDDSVSEAWKKISALDFYLMEIERQEDPHAISYSSGSA